MTELSSVIDKFGVYIYKSPLIYFRLENFKDWRHRKATIEKDPMANAYICKLDEEIFTENPKFEPDILEGEVLTTWIEEGWIDLFITMFNMARTHKFCVVALYDSDPYWRVFTEEHIDKIQYDKNDNPVSCDVSWTFRGYGQDELKQHKEHILFNTDRNDQTEKYNGLYISFGTPETNDLEAIWDLLIYIRYQMLDMVNNSAKTSGFFHFVYGNAIRDDQTAELKSALDYTGIGQAVGAKEQVLKDIKFHTPEHPEFTIEAMDESLNILAGSCRLPLSFFKGEKAGGGVFQEGFSDEAKITKKKKYIFSQFKKYIIRLIKMRWGKIITDVNPYIEEEIQQDNMMEQKAQGQFGKDHFSDKPQQVDKKLA